MDLTTGIIVTLLIAAGIYFAYWATRRVMHENQDKVQQARKRNRKR